MAVKNQLVKGNTQQTSKMMTYMAGGQEVKISPAMVKAYCVSGNPDNVTDAEVNMYLFWCRGNQLNPLNRESYLIKYGKDAPATMIVGKDVMFKRAFRNPNFDGIEKGIVVKSDDMGIEERQGTIYDKETEKLVGAWAKVYIKDKRIPIYCSVNFSEYNTGKSSWNLRPAEMIVKVAAVHALREAFPEDLATFYDAAEMNVDANLTELPVNPEAVPQPAPAPVAPAPEVIPAPAPEQPEDITNILFGEG